MLFPNPSGNWSGDDEYALPPNPQQISAEYIESLPGPNWTLAPKPGARLVSHLTPSDDLKPGEFHKRGDVVVFCCSYCGGVNIPRGVFSWFIQPLPTVHQAFCCSNCRAQYFVHMGTSYPVHSTSYPVHSS